VKEFITQKAKEVFGSGCEIVKLERLLGGAQKHTWLAERGDGFRFNGLLTGLPDEEDEARMDFYHIGHCFGNLRGAVELRQKGYYDMDDANGMINFFYSQFEV